MNFHDTYEIKHLLGRGSYGYVFLLESKITGRLYAGKFLSIDRLTNRAVEKIKQKNQDEYIDTSYKKRIVNNINRQIKSEIDILKLLKDVPHTIKYIESYNDVLYESSKYEGSIYSVIVMEYIEGNSLKKFFKCLILQEETIPEYVLLKFMLEMFDCIRILHSKNIVHRDIKLENILFNNLDLKLIDFGLSCVIDAKHDDIRCKRGRAGTLHYMAPELFNIVTTTNIYKASDIWALGVMFYALSNKNYPFGGSSEEDMKNKILAGITVDSIYPRNIIDNIIYKCLTYDHNKRPTAEYLYNYISSFLKNK